MKNILSKTVTLVLAGGRGERLAPLTRERSKPAVPFGEGCIIDFVLTNCLQSNLFHPFILTQYRSAHLSNHVRRWWQQQPARADSAAAPVCVPAPESEYLGTANALLRNLHLLDRSTEHILVLSADHIYSMDYRELLQFHVDRRADATLGAIVYPRESSQQFGILDVDGSSRIVGFEEKPKHPRELPGRPGSVLANMGIYVFRREVLVDVLQQDACNRTTVHDIGRNVLPNLVVQRDVHAFRFEYSHTRRPRYWRDVGTLDSYYEANMDWLGQLPGSHPLAGTRSVIAQGARVHHTAEVVDSILMPGVVVGPHARVHRAILDNGVHVMRGARIGFGEVNESEYKRTPRGVYVIPANSIVPSMHDPMPSRFIPDSVPLLS